MFRREHQIGGSEQRVLPGREDGHFVFTTPTLPFDDERHFRALGLADPVALKQLDRLRPIEILQLVDEPLGVSGDPQIPLPQGPALDGVPLGFPFLDFLVGQHRPQIRGPVHRNLGHKGEPHRVHLGPGPTACLQFRDRPGALRRFVEVGMVKLEEDPLRPAHIIGVGGVDLALPIIRKPEPLELGPEVVDVLLRGDPGCCPVLMAYCSAGRPKASQPMGGARCIPSSA